MHTNHNPRYVRRYSRLPTNFLLIFQHKKIAIPFFTSTKKKQTHGSNPDTKNTWGEGWATTIAEASLRTSCEDLSWKKDEKHADIGLIKSHLTIPTRDKRRYYWTRFSHCDAKYVHGVQGGENVLSSRAFFVRDRWICVSTCLCLRLVRVRFFRCANMCFDTVWSMLDFELRFDLVISGYMKIVVCIFSMKIAMIAFFRRISFFHKRRLILYILKI